ncbi:MAG: hypothetical protein WAW96_22050 [Alphaproteobacteria bacterium]
MDALIAPAQVWVPSAGLAGLLLLRAFCGLWLCDARLAGTRGYFIALGLAILLPLAAALLAWSIQGGIAQWGPLVLLSAPVDIGERHALMASFAAPAVIFLLFRFLFSSADALAYAAAAAAGFVFAHLFGPVAAIAAALAIGGLVGFADKLVGEIPMAIAGATAFSLLFGYVYAGGGPAIPLLALSVVGGIALSLIAASGSRTRIPLYVVLTPLPAFALASLASNGMLDPSHSMPKPAVGSYGSLLILFVVFPAVAAPFVALSLWFTRRVAALVDSSKQIWIGPFAVIVELIIGIALSAVLALALAAGGALFNRLHLLSGGGELFDVWALIFDMRRAPLDGSNWWLLALLALPVLPAFIQLLRCATKLFLSLLAWLRIRGWLDGAISNGGFAQRAVARLALFVLQLVPGALILTAMLTAVHPIERHYGGTISQAANTIIDASGAVVRRIEGSRIMASLCLGGPSCR